ncbi:MAG: hypothetical protein DRG78_03435 [Epsilonproteobacteria bacterium]|nr:MAG: hypothetical protein DRG78_03435 [Campylobacterota bacterium]
MAVSIHNVYSDLLSAFSYYLNNRILEDIKINSFEFNIGNESFKLDYKPNYSLPAAIIELESPTAFINRPNIFRTQTNAVETIPVLYDHEKDIGISVVEDLYNVNFIVNINCESQIQALTIQQTILNFIPVGKYLHFLEFTSFLEIDESVLNPYLFDINNDTIDNLFFKQNRINNTLDYCFGISYNPLIRLANINVQLEGSVSSSSFQVQASFEALHHIPAKFIYPPNIDTNTAFMETSINANFIELANTITPTTTAASDYDFLKIGLLNQDNGVKKDVLVPLDKVDSLNDDPFQASTLLNETITYTTDDGIVLKIEPNVKYQEYTFKYSGILSDNLTSIEGTGRLFRNLETDTLYGYLEGSLSGKVNKINFIDADSATMWFNGLNNSNRRFLTEQLTINFYELRIVNIIDNSTVKIIQLQGQNWALVYVNGLVNKNNIYSSLTLSKTNTVLRSFSIGGIIVKDYVPNNDFTLDTIYLTKPSDDPSNVYEVLETTKIVFNVEGNVISFSIDPTTGQISNLYSQVDLDIVSILFTDLKFFYSNVYGTKINNINIQFNAIDEPISTSISLSELNNNYSTTILYNDITDVISSTTETKEFKLIINKAIRSRIDLNNLNWEIRVFDQLISDITRAEYFTFLPTSSDTEQLTFTCTDEFFYKYLDNVTSIYPLKLSLLFINQ